MKKSCDDAEAHSPGQSVHAGVGCSEQNFSGHYQFCSGQRESFASDNDKRNEPVSAKLLAAGDRPLGEQNRDTMGLVAWWHNFARHEYVAATHGSKRVKDYARYRDDDLPRNDDLVASWRTGRELIARGKIDGLELEEFWKLKEPSLGLVQLAQRRWQVYRDARKRARQHLLKFKLLFKLSDYATPADAFWHIEQGFWDSNEAKKLANQLTEAEKEMVRKPAKLLDFVAQNLNAPHNIPEIIQRTHRTTLQFFSNWEFMQRCACGLTSLYDLCLTLPTFFPKLTLEEKMNFLKLTHTNPQQLKKNRLSLLAAWLEDNAPFFSEFRWHPEAVLDVAAEKFHDHDQQWIPKSAESLTQFCRRARPGIKLGLHRARFVHETDRFAQPHKVLLTDPPIPI